MKSGMFFTLRKDVIPSYILIAIPFIFSKKDNVRTK